MSALTRITSAIAGLFGTDANALPLSNRNYIVDGNFDQWTATSQANPGAAYGPSPMYLNYVGTSGAGTVSQGIFGGGEPVGLTSPARFAMVHAQTTAGTTASFIQQKIESAYTLQGRSATFSCWLWVASGTLTITQLIAVQNFGTGGSPSAAVSVSPTVNWVVTTTPKRFSVRLDFPSVAGKTFGTAGNDCLQIGVYFPIGPTFTLTTAQWQLEKSSPRASSDLNGNGGAATAFEYRGLSAELQRVQRYYWNSYPTGSYPGSVAGFGLLNRLTSTGTAGDSYPVVAQLLHPVCMRAVPAMTCYSNVSGASGKVYAAADVPGFFGIASMQGFTLQVSNTQVSAGSNLTAHVVADARL